MKRRLFLTAVPTTCLIGASSSFSHAHNTSKNGKIIFGFAPKSSGSLLGKKINQILQATSQWPVTYEFQNIENRSSFKALEIVNASSPNDHFLLQALSSQFSLFPITNKNISFNLTEAFKPIAVLGTYTWSFVVGPMVPVDVKTMQDYFAWTQNNSERKNIGVSLNASQGHLIGLLLSSSGKNINKPIVYAGTSGLIHDLLNQSLPAAMLITGNAPELFKSQQLRTLSVVSKDRWFSMPDVPCFKELGLPYLEKEGWFGWFAPSTMPSENAETLSKLVNQSIQSPDGSQTLLDLQIKADISTPQQMTEKIAQERIYFDALVKQTRFYHPND